MIIKTFTEESSSKALKKVRKEMGGDAFVLKTREVMGNDNIRRVEVTACLEGPSVAQTSKIFPDSNNIGDGTDRKATTVAFENPKRNTSPSKENNNVEKSSPGIDELLERVQKIEIMLNGILSFGFRLSEKNEKFAPYRQIYQKMKDSDVPASFLDSFMLSLVSDGSEKTCDISVVRQRLVAMLSGIMVPDLTFKPGDKVLFVGSAGAGKSSVLGKVAATLVTREKLKVKLLSLDDVKIAAMDEICSYAELLGIESIKADSVTGNKNDNSGEVLLIDTPALPHDHRKLKMLKDKINRIEPDYCLAVFSALTRSSDQEQIAGLIKELSPTHVAITMTDLTERHGSVVTAAIATGLKVAFVTNSSGGIGKINTPDPALLARQLLNVEVSLE